MEPKRLLPHSQVPATCPSPDHSNPFHDLQIDSFKTHFNTIFPFTSVSSKWSLSLRFSQWNAIWKFLFLFLWFHALLIYINNCPTRCNTKQSIYASANSLYMFQVSTTPITKSTQNCKYSLRYWSYFLCSYLPPTWPSLSTLEGGSCNRLICVASRWTVINIARPVFRYFTPLGPRKFCAPPPYLFVFSYV